MHEATLCLDSLAALPPAGRDQGQAKEASPANWPRSPDAADLTALGIFCSSPLCGRLDEATMTTPFQTEAWTEYAIGVIILFLRIFARWKVVGFKWQGDDYFTIGVLIFWTAELSMLELIGQYGTNIGIYDNIGATLSKEQIRRYEIGSKCLLAGWTCYVTLIWCLKACMLFFYNRITLGLAQQKAVKITAVLCVLAYIAVIAVIYGHCTPVHKNWQVYPYPGDNCSKDIPNYLAIVTTNMSTDFMILCIPIPLLWKVKIPLRRKLLIGLLLCSGIFIMTATLLRCLLSLKDINGINTSTIWAIRETFVGIVAVNASCIKPLFSASRWLRSSKNGSSNKMSNQYAYGNNSYQLSSQLERSQGGFLSNKSTKRVQTENSSEEMIVKDFDTYRNDVSVGVDVSNGGKSSFGEGMLTDGIHVTTTYEVTPSRRDEYDV
ncbi:hypothetical protein VTN77DRAFT_4693 [Rasamsonia byssochlamydoides]|uniref:uncharacterized protein n=1 Tax=Rasamsonia byssochlamydoides TaxID=89139 RepID=UPI003742CFDB